MSGQQNDSACSQNFVFLEINCGHGVCNSTIGKCICDPGYTNFGDFSLNHAGSCDLFNTAIVGEWIAVLVIVAISFCFAAWALVVRYRLKILFDRRTWRIGIIPFLQLINCSLATPLAILKIMNSTYAIGGSITPTLLSLFLVQCVVFSLYSGYMLFLKISVSLLPISSEQRYVLREHSHSLARFTVAIMILASIMSWSPFLMLINPDYTQISAYLIGIGLGTLMLVVGSGTAVLFLTRLIVSVRETLKNVLAMQEQHSARTDQLESLLLRLRVARGFMLVGFPGVTIILELFCFFPYLTKKASYIYPLAFIAGLLAVDILLWTVTNSGPTGRVSRKFPSTDERAALSPTTE